MECRLLYCGQEPQAVQVDSDLDCLFCQPVCLHQRLCNPARRLNCDSRWIDSACILKSPGYSWAPVNPVTKPVRRKININNRPCHFPVKYHIGYDGEGSWVGTIPDNGLWNQWLFIDMTPDALPRYEENYNTYSKSTIVAELLEGSPGSEGDLDFPPESLLPDWLDIDVSCRTIEG